MLFRGLTFGEINQSLLGGLVAAKLAPCFCPPWGSALLTAGLVAFGLKQINDIGSPEPGKSTPSIPYVGDWSTSIVVQGLKLVAKLAEDSKSSVKVAPA